jgi:hypothetical protein
VPACDVVDRGNIPPADKGISKWQFYFSVNGTAPLDSFCVKRPRNPDA